MFVNKLIRATQAGSQVVLYLLIVLSVLSLGIILERWIYFYRRRPSGPSLASDLDARLRSGDLAGAQARLHSDRSVEAGIVAGALDWYDSGAEAMAEILQRGIRERRPELESGLLFLGTLGNNAPFIGLFGTVLGIVTAFRELGAGTQGAMTNVMGGIAEALIATAIGILVALPAVVAYNVFQKKCADLEERVAGLGNLLTAHYQRSVHRAGTAVPAPGPAPGQPPQNGAALHLEMEA